MPGTIDKQPYNGMGPGFIAPGRLHLSAGQGVSLGSLGAGVVGGSSGLLAGSSDQRGRVTITVAAAGATAANTSGTITFSEPYPNFGPCLSVDRTGGTEAVTTDVRVLTVTSTGFTFQMSAAPGANATIVFDYQVVG